MFFFFHFLLLCVLDIYSQMLTDVVIKWSKKSFITDENLVRAMFSLVYRQYNALGEVIQDPF